MPHRLFRLARTGPALLLAALLSLGCARDASGDAQAERVVCVSKQINEFMYDIGAQHVLVARDLTSIYPPQITKLPSVGYHRALSAEGIISMKPTLFLTDGNVGPDAVLDELRKVGIPVLVMEPGHSPDSAQLLMTRLGARFHRERAADSIVRQWRAGMDSVLADSARWTGARRPRVLVIHFGQIINDYLALKRGGPADEMLHWAGAENAIDSAGGMARLTPELIAKSAPDIIVATDVGFDRYGSAERFAHLPGVALTPAGKAKRIYRIDEQEIMYFGPRTPATVRKLAALFHPGTT
jgi:iron complex transport system substrate-binding protein